ncbi:hypothetical protein Bbelb_012850 [Branchiostoma belcheri]|nr:hypothetical protein Bbelb_012850 [Branchiostoma belcheri]
MIHNYPKTTYDIRTTYVLGAWRIDDLSAVRGLSVRRQGRSDRTLRVSSERRAASQRPYSRSSIQTVETRCRPIHSKALTTVNISPAGRVGGYKQNVTREQRSRVRVPHPYRSV